MQKNNNAIYFDLQSSIKAKNSDLDKTLAPSKTVENVLGKLEKSNLEILQSLERIDIGRLDIPVFISKVGIDASYTMATKKQMGKGSTEDQAKASALMELVERYSYFDFWHREKNTFFCKYSMLEDLSGKNFIDFDMILASVNEKLSEDKKELAKKIFDLVDFNFYPALHLATNEIYYVPLEWFKMLNEFNGTAAGNNDSEAIFQSICELVERHVCAIVSSSEHELATIELDSIEDEVLKNLIDKFAKQNIKLILKDFSLGMPLPTIGAIAYDLSTFPEKSEIVYTAGTASSPIKAAIRALTEIAQLGGDFCTSSCYEASGLPKYTNIKDIAFLEKGELVNISSLPDISDEDILQELKSTAKILKTEHGIDVFSINTTVDTLNISTCYSFGTGFLFRERDANACLGLYVGRKLIEDCDSKDAEQGLALIEELYGETSFTYFFRALINGEDSEFSRELFIKALELEQNKDSYGLIAYYCAYSYMQEEDFSQAVSILDKAILKSPDFFEALSARGVCHFKLKEYKKAIIDLKQAIKIDKSSAKDYANLGACYYELKDFTNAKNHLKTAILLDPSLERAKERLATL